MEFLRTEMSEIGQKALTKRKECPHIEQCAGAFHLTQKVKEVQFHKKPKAFQSYGNKCVDDIPYL